MVVEGATPWGAMLRAACGLGVRPKAFWRLSLKEWRMLTEAPDGGQGLGLGQGLGRSDFDRLTAAWPDEGSGDDD